MIRIIRRIRFYPPLGFVYQERSKNTNRPDIIKERKEKKMHNNFYKCSKWQKNLNESFCKTKQIKMSNDENRKKKKSGS